MLLEPMVMGEEMLA